MQIYVPTSIRWDGLTMRYRTGPSLDMSVSTIRDTGTIRIREDSGSQQPATKVEKDGRIVILSLDITDETRCRKSSSPMSR